MTVAWIPELTEQYRNIPRLPGRNGPQKPSSDVRQVGSRLGWQFSPLVLPLRVLLVLVILHPLMSLFSSRKTYGKERLASVAGPVIFAANHLSVADNPAVLLALPWRWRLRLATAASEEVMRSRGRLQSFFAAIISNGFYFSQTTSIRSSITFCGKLTAARWSLLFFPEGVRSDDGELGPFKPGIGLLAVRLGVPVVPVHLKGTDSVVAKGGSRPRRGSTEVRFGDPLHFPPGTAFPEAAREIREAILSLSKSGTP